MNTTNFNWGDTVLVTPLDDGSEPTQEFVGKIVDIKLATKIYIQVKDQNDNVFDCEPRQVHHVK